MSAPRPRDQAELANLLSEIARLWPDHSQRSIARKLGFKPGVVSGLVARARRNGDAARFPARPNPTPKPPPKVRLVKPVDKTAAKPTGSNKEPVTRPKPQLLIDLDWQGCRWPTGAAADGRHTFCGAPTPRYPYCPACAPRAKGGAGARARFVLPAIGARSR
jgi:hypothetical protein